MCEITQERKRNGILYVIHYKAQILIKDIDQPQIMHNLELSLTYHTKNAKKVTHVTSQIFSKKTKKSVTLPTPKTNKKTCIFL